MTLDPRQSIVQITSSIADNRNFGTGFVIYRVEAETFVVTCAHVVRDVGGRECIQVAGLPASVIAEGEPDGIDIAVLKVAGLVNLIPLALSLFEPKPPAITVRGYSEYGRYRTVRDLTGQVGKRFEIESLDHTNRVEAWDFAITDDDSLERGYSGSPVFDQNSGNVIGVVIARRDESRGSAISITALVEVWPDLPSNLVMTVPSFSTEIQDSLRDNASLTNTDRTIRLEEQDTESRARCIMRWQAAGVPMELASEFANSTVGTPELNLRPTPLKPLLLLIGEIGTGKSLVAERLFQIALTTSREDPSSPIPVFLDAKSVGGNLSESVKRNARGLGDLRRQGATVIIDGADEAGVETTSKLLDEARLLISTLPKTTVVLTSRPVAILHNAQEAISVPYLTEDAAYDIIGQVAGREISKYMQWPSSVMEAIRRPLFAVLVGTFLREQASNNAPRSPSDLIRHLIERSLERTTVNLGRMNALLLRLAALVIERGGFVPVADVALGEELQSLLETRLVIKRGNAIGFPLQILAEWFAAHSLVSGTPSINELVDNQASLERWRYAIAVLVSIFSHDQVSTVLMPLVRADPAFAAEIVYGSIAAWGAQGNIALPSRLESGYRVQKAMMSWIEGIGPLANLLAPLREDGTLMPLGVWISNMW